MQPRILVVEDEVIVQLDLSHQLRRLGYDVVATASSADEACAFARQHQPDLILMDINLGMSGDGIDAALKIQRERVVPIVFLTAYVDDQTLERAKDVGPYGYLIKPYESRSLHTALQMALHKGKLDQQTQQSHAGLLAALESRGYEVIVLDDTGRVTAMSQNLCSLLGLKEVMVVGLPWQDLLDPSAGSDALTQQIASGGSEEQTYALRRRRGKTTVNVTLSVQSRPELVGGKVLIVRFISREELPVTRRQPAPQFAGIIGASEPIKQLILSIQDFSQVDVSVLIEGETGSGKELVARAIHSCSKRKNEPFVALNCAGLGEELATSQLFGHRKGSFTGAFEDQTGLFEAAHGGTLFLDEIGELSLRAQTLLLRVLEEKAVIRIGENRTRPVNVRIVAATNRSLSREAAEGRFRPDLLYRLRVGRIHVPPLRERVADIPILAEAFLTDQATRSGKATRQISAAAMAMLNAYLWPGNVRELKNALEYAAIRLPTGVIEPANLPSEIAEAISGNLQDDRLDERSRILLALKQTKGNRSLAAELLGVSRATFYRRLAQLGIAFDD